MTPVYSPILINIGMFQVFFIVRLKKAKILTVIKFKRVKLSGCVSKWHKYLFSSSIYMVPLKRIPFLPISLCPNKNVITLTKSIITFEFQLWKIILKYHLTNVILYWITFFKPMYLLFRDRKNGWIQSLFFGNNGRNAVFTRLKHCF